MTLPPQHQPYNQPTHPRWNYRATWTATGSNMVLPRDEHFVHRANGDGTTDSVCRHCFVTVCTSLCETDLAEAERRHVCDPAVVARFKEISTSVAERKTVSDM